MLRVLGLSILVFGSAGVLAAAAPAADGGASSAHAGHAGHVVTPAPPPVEEPVASHAGHTGAPATTKTTKTTSGHDHGAATTPTDHEAAPPAEHEDHGGATEHDAGRVAATPSSETRHAVVAGFFLVNAAIMLTALAVGLRHPRRRRRLA
jgi:hypothetical protein